MEPRLGRTFHSSATGRRRERSGRGRVLGAWLTLGGRRGRADRGGQVLVVPGDRPLDGLAEVVPQVPAVSDLDRSGCAAGAAV
jgi:hypothetical protein